MSVRSGRVSSFYKDIFFFIFFFPSANVVLNQLILDSRTVGSLLLTVTAG